MTVGVTPNCAPLIEEPNIVPPVAAVHHCMTPILVTALKTDVNPVQTCVGVAVTLVGGKGSSDVTVTVTETLVALGHVENASAQ